MGGQLKKKKLLLHFSLWIQASQHAAPVSTPQSVMSQQVLSYGQLIANTCCDITDCGGGQTCCMERGASAVCAFDAILALLNYINICEQPPYKSHFLNFSQPKKYFYKKQVSFNLPNIVCTQKALEIISEKTSNNSFPSVQVC